MITKREIHTTSNGHTVELRTLDTGAVMVISPNFVNVYLDPRFARRVANIVFVELVTGCYACALDKVGRDGVLDNSPHVCAA